MCLDSFWAGRKLDAERFCNAEPPRVLGIATPGKLGCRNAVRINLYFKQINKRGGKQKHGKYFYCNFSTWNTYCKALHVSKIKFQGKVFGEVSFIKNQCLMKIHLSSTGFPSLFCSSIFPPPCRTLNFLRPQTLCAAEGGLTDVWGEECKKVLWKF